MSSGRVYFMTQKALATKTQISGCQEPGPGHRVMWADVSREREWWPGAAGGDATTSPSPRLTRGRGPGGDIN